MRDVFAVCWHSYGRLLRTDLSNNYGRWKGDTDWVEEFIRPIASMLKTNTSLKELSLAGNNLNAEAARIFSQDIQDNGALASITFGDKKPVTINTTMTESDFSNKGLGVSGAIILTAWLKHK